MAFLLVGLRSAQTGLAQDRYRSSVSLARATLPYRMMPTSSLMFSRARNRGFDGLVILWLGDPEDRIVWNRQALSVVDLDGSPVAFRVN